MPNIVIREQDLTSSGVAVSDNNVAFIPGFVDLRDSNFDDPKTRVAPHTPKLCATVAEFEAYFGKHPITFDKDQAYPTGFSASSKPVSVPMFKKGDKDPSYIMAKELLAQGLSVVYEGINTSMLSGNLVDEFTAVTKEPDNWGETYDEYYYKLSDAYAPYTGTKNYVTPEFAAYTYFMANADTFKQTVADSTGKADGYVVGRDFTQVYLQNYAVNYSIDADGKQVPYENGQTAPTREFAYVGELFSDYLPIYDSAKKIKYTSVSEMPGSWTSALDSYFILPKYIAVGGSASAGDYVSLEKAFGIDKAFTQLTTAPDDWAEKYYNYFAVDSDVYKGVDSVELITVPAFKESNTYYKSGFSAGISVGSMYSAFNTIFDELTDKGTYSIKYITSGGYPTFEYSGGATNKMINLASTRKDAFALIDATNNPERKLNPVHPSSVYYAVMYGSDFDGEEVGKYATMMYPYCNFKRVSSDKYGNTSLSDSVQLPASFAYLASLAQSLKSNNDWDAIAGERRGAIPNLDSNEKNGYYPLCLDEVLTNTIADAYQPRNNIAINPITKINGKYCIWGNRTLKRNSENLTATSFLNIRNFVCDVTKNIYSACKKLMFEQDTEELWLNFIAALTPLLDKAKTGNGLEDYKIVRQPTTERGKVVAVIRLYPVYAVEDWDITVTLEDSDVSIS